MKVKVGDKVYDGELMPVMVVLEPGDKQNIQNMHPDCARYCIYPVENYTRDEIVAWMEDI